MTELTLLNESALLFYAKNVLQTFSNLMTLNLGESANNWYKNMYLFKKSHIFHLCVTIYTNNFILISIESLYLLKWAIISRLHKK